MLAIVENKWDIKYIQILPVPTEGCSGKYWRRSSWLKNLVNVKYHAL